MKKRTIGWTMLLSAVALWISSSAQAGGFLRGSHGSSGSGGASWGSHGSSGSSGSAGSHGSSGSSGSYGSRGGLLRGPLLARASRGSLGSHGSSGSSGASWGSHGSSGSGHVVYHSTTANHASVQVQTVRTAHPVLTTPQVESRTAQPRATNNCPNDNCQASAASTSKTSQNRAIASLVVELPSHASLYLVNTKMKSSGSLRQFTVPVATADRVYDYPVRIEANGTSLSLSLNVKAGQSTQVRIASIEGRLVAQNLQQPLKPQLLARNE